MLPGSSGASAHSGSGSEPLSQMKSGSSLIMNLFDRPDGAPRHSSSLSRCEYARSNAAYSSVMSDAAVAVELMSFSNFSNWARNISSPMSRTVWVVTDKRMPKNGPVHNPPDCEPQDHVRISRWHASRYPSPDEYWSLVQNGYQPGREVIHNVVRSLGDVGNVG